MVKMNIGSIKKTSLLDYPGKLSAIIGTQGCNMRCPWCHNFYLIPYNFAKHSELITQEDLFCFLDQRKNFLDAIVITGGEPTIQSDLPQLCEHVKKMGFAVKIDTNGTNPDVLNRLLKNELVDYIAMDLKTDLDKYNQLFKEKIDVKKILESIDIIMSSDKPYEFRTTCVSPFVTTDNIDQIGMLIKGAKFLFLQKCNQVKNTDNRSQYEIINGNRLDELKERADRYVLNCEIR
jgi:pyruvate formate lyase activating enzyme